MVANQSGREAVEVYEWFYVFGIDSNALALSVAGLLHLATFIEHPY
jgi:hypothetical protein